MEQIANVRSISMHTYSRYLFAMADDMHFFEKDYPKRILFKIKNRYLVGRAIIAKLNLTSFLAFRRSW